MGQRLFTFPLLAQTSLPSFIIYSHGRFQNTGLSWDCGIDNTSNYAGVFHWCRPMNLYEVVQIINQRQKDGFDKDFTESFIE